MIVGSTPVQLPKVAVGRDDDAVGEGAGGDGVVDGTVVDPGLLLGDVVTGTVEGFVVNGSVVVVEERTVSLTAVPQAESRVSPSSESATFL